ncbi:MAG TPA: hypothetical protein VGF48_25495 [Thermoanaerobaculia bacterium]|jgi:hypothetical protein
MHKGWAPIAQEPVAGVPGAAVSAEKAAAATCKHIDHLRFSVTKNGLTRRYDALVAALTIASVELHPVRVALIVAILVACSPGAKESRHHAVPEPVVPPEIASLALDSLRAAAEIKMSGDAGAVVREHALSPRYAAAMSKHFALMRELHLVGLQSRVRYPRSTVSVRHEQFCEQGLVAHLVVTAMVRHDMESIAPASGAPPYTAAQEEHVFRFARRNDGTWVMTNHHEIDLAEMHQEELAARLRNPCGRASSR